MVSENGGKLWAFLIWDYEAGCWHQSGLYPSEHAANMARDRAPIQWRDHSPVYAVPSPPLV